MTALATLPFDGGPIELRAAVADDVPAIVALLADDPLGRARDGAAADDLAPYQAAFAAIERDPAQLLLVATDGSQLVATAQLSFLTGLSRRGATRMQIEAVRVDRAHRSAGLGAAMMRWAIEEARRRGCAIAQLTSDNSRSDAHRFYERLGFVASHTGFKLPL